MKELTFSKQVPENMTKREYYTKMLSTLVEKAKEMNTDTIELSAEFASILFYSNMDFEFNDYVIGAYTLGWKDGITFIISPDYYFSGKLGDLSVQLISESDGE